MQLSGWGGVGCRVQSILNVLWYVCTVVYAVDKALCDRNVLQLID